MVTLLLLYNFRKAFNSLGHLYIIRSFKFVDEAIWFFSAYFTDCSMITEEYEERDPMCGVGEGPDAKENLFWAFFLPYF